MQIDDFDTSRPVASVAELDHCLRTHRRGDFGAFILAHRDEGSSFWVLINQDIAYLHFFITMDGSHPGYQPTGMTPKGCPATVHFLQTSGSEADSFDMVAEALVSVEAAYVAAREYFSSDELPHSVSWLELWTNERDGVR